MSSSLKTWLPSYGSAPVTRRRFLKASAAGAGAAALIACGGGSTSTAGFQDAADSRQPGKVWFAKNDWQLKDETKGAVRGGIYRGYQDADQDGHYDAITLLASQVPFSRHVHEMLMAKNRGPGIDPASVEANNPIGSLAESWEFSPDWLTLTFTLRKGVKWHPISPVDGREMDMDDWKTSLERHLELGFYRKAFDSALDSVEYPDDRHMVWNLKAPFAPMFDFIYHDKAAFPIQPKELNASARLAEGLAIGTGYKILDKHQPAIGMEYRKFPEYWGGDPFIERWHSPIIPEYSNLYAQFITGNIQDFTTTARDVLIMAKDAPGAVIIANPIPTLKSSRYRFGWEDADKQPWADPRVRIAIRRSIDFPAIAKFLSNEEEFARNGIDVEFEVVTHLSHNPAFWLNPEKGELGEDSKNYLYGLDEAKKLMAAAGYGDEPPELFWPVRLRSGEVPEETTLVKDSLARAGTFKLDVLQVSGSQEYNKYRLQGQHNGLIGTWSGGGDYDPDYHIFRDYHSEGRGEGRPYPHAEIDRLGHLQRGAMDLEERWGYLKEFQIFMAGWMASIPGPHYFNSFSFRQPWLRNATYGEGGQSWPPAGRPTLGGHLHWLDEAMPNRERGAT